MLKIKEIDTFLVDLPTIRPHVLSMATMHRQTIVVARTVVGNHFAKSAVETALLDAMGKRVGLPVSELLGGRHRDELLVAWTLASGDTAKDIEEAARMLSLRRHNIFKLKIGKRAVADERDKGVERPFGTINFNFALPHAVEGVPSTLIERPRAHAA